MRSANAVWSGLPPPEAPEAAEAAHGLGARTLALRVRLRRRLRRRALAPFLGVDPLRWRNTTRGVRLFARAAFAGLPTETAIEHDAAPEHADRTVCALFVFGAIELAADLGALPAQARRRLELVFLRHAFGVGRMRARCLRRELWQRGRTPRGHATLCEGRVALREWFEGLDPSFRLRDRLSDGQRGTPAAASAPFDDVRRRPARLRRPERGAALARML